jgi:phospholipid/cholesterol/gamma-HCH transport system permease protein
MFAALFGVFGGLLAGLIYHVPSGEFWATFFANVDTTDLWGSVLKDAIFGAIIAIVACYKGMTARGGAEGVGRAVNEAVVTTLLLNSAVNYVFTQVLLATHPNIVVLKG